MSERKDWYTIDEASEELGIVRETLFAKFKLLGIQSHAFKGEKHKFINYEELERIRKAIEEPWTLPERHVAPRKPRRSRSVKQAPGLNG